MTGKKHVEFISYTVGPGDFHFSTIFCFFFWVCCGVTKISDQIQKGKKNSYFVRNLVPKWLDITRFLGKRCEFSYHHFGSLSC